MSNPANFQIPGPLEIHHWAWLIAGIFTLASVVISFWIIGEHILHYEHRRLQRYMIRIVFMIPIYVIGSYLSLLMKDKAFYFTLIRDCYESYVLYMFFRLLIELADGEEELIHKLEHIPQLRCFMPLCCCHIKPGRIFLHRCKQMLLQFVIFKPILAIIIFILSAFEVYDEGSFNYHKGYLYITIFYNISFTIALYFLVLFYEATKNILKQYKPISKFICIKAIIFFSYWQSIIISVLVYFHIGIQEKDDWSVSDVATAIQNFLICIEMFPLSIAHRKSFGYYALKEAKQSGEILLIDEKPNVVQSIVDAANITDVFQETYIALKRGPKRNVIVGNFLNLTLKEQKKHVIKEGWMSKRGEDLAKIWKKRYHLLIDEPKGLVYFKKNPYESISNINQNNNNNNNNNNIMNIELEEISSTPKLKARGFIDFYEVISIETHPKNNERFIILTSARKWHFKCRSNKEKNEWLDAIKSLFETIGIENNDKEKNKIKLKNQEEHMVEIDIHENDDIEHVNNNSL